VEKAQETLTVSNLRAREIPMPGTGALHQHFKDLPGYKKWNQFERIAKDAKPDTMNAFSRRHVANQNVLQ
jgi:hypothetical protein